MGRGEHSLYISLLRGPSAPLAGGPGVTFHTHLGPLDKDGGGVGGGKVPSINLHNLPWASLGQKGLPPHRGLPKDVLHWTIPLRIPGRTPFTFPVVPCRPDVAKGHSAGMTAPLTLKVRCIRLRRGTRHHLTVHRRRGICLLRRMATRDFPYAMLRGPF